MLAESDEETDDAVPLNLSRELFSNTSSYFIGILSPKSKQLLTRPKDERTGPALSDLLAEMENIDFFKMFSSRTKETLAKTLRFIARPADQPLLVQGETVEPPQALYVIMSGVVTEHYRPDPISAGDRNSGEDLKTAEDQTYGKNLKTAWNKTFGKGLKTADGQTDDKDLKTATDDYTIGKGLKTAEDKTAGKDLMIAEEETRVKGPKTAKDQTGGKCLKITEDDACGRSPRNSKDKTEVWTTKDQINGEGLKTAEDGASDKSPEDKTKVWPEKILRKGEFFGHVDLVYDRPPTVDAQTVGYCEFLVLPKEDFGVVRKEMEALCTRAGRYLCTTEAIGRFGWSEEEYKVLEIYTKLCTYAENQHVYGGVDDCRPYWSYFVVSGECRVVRELPSHRVQDSSVGKVTESNHKEASAGDKVRLAFEEAKQGYFFGVGESFRGNHVIASSTLECLLVPRLVLVFKDREMLRAMARDLTESLPSDQEVLEVHSKLAAASKKKVEMFKELFKRKPQARRLIES